MSSDSGPVNRTIVSLPWRPVHRPAAEQMEMQVEHRLAAVPARVHNQPVAALGDALLLGDLVADEQQMSEQARVGFIQLSHGGHMPARDHQRVDRSLGIDVVKGDALVVFVDDFGGNRLRGDLAEQAVAHDVPLPLPFLIPDFPYRPASSR